VRGVEERGTKLEYEGRTGLTRPLSIPGTSSGCSPSPTLPSSHPSLALKFHPSDTVPFLPCVISAYHIGTNGAHRQRETLEAEGVDVVDGWTGKMRVDFARWGWFPAIGSTDIDIEVEGVNAGWSVRDLLCCGERRATVRGSDSLMFS
jgi:hypothetical protein